MSTALTRATAPSSNVKPVLFAPATEHAPPKVCVVAEIGVNHDGQVQRAVELVDAAADAGTDAVKLQLFDPKFLLSDQAVLAAYQRASDHDVVAMLDRLKLSVDDMLSVQDAARKRALQFVITPFSLENFAALQVLNPDAIKIASPDAVNLPLLGLTASLNRPMLISTGATDLAELDPTAELLSRRDDPVCYLQCVSSYPTPADEAALGGIVVLANRFGMPVGYSDHTTDVATGAMAVTCGACVIEKHITYDCGAPGPDHAASFEPDQFANYVKQIRQAATMLGPCAKRHRHVEEEVRQICRQSLCLKRDLSTGSLVTREDLTTKRPGTGIPAAHFEQVIGRRLNRPVKANSILLEAHLD